jgi:hypothetical protein
VRAREVRERGAVGGARELGPGKERVAPKIWKRGIENGFGRGSVWWGRIWGEPTERRFRRSRRWRGTTVTISISQRKATSIGVRPACRGNAMVAEGLCLVLRLELMY